MPQPNATLEDLETIMRQQEGCPICHYGRLAGRKYLDGVMYESVNDYGLRQQLTKTMGFCAFHSQEMLTFPGSKLGAAIIERAMLQEALRRMETASQGRSTFFSRSVKTNHANHIPDQYSCPACQHEQAAEIRAIEELMKRWDDVWATLLENTGGLCFNHLMHAIKLTPKSTGQSLKVMHERIWQDLTSHLDEFIRKQDYRFRDEIISDEEGNASRRAISVLTGEPRTIIHTKITT